MISVRSLIAAHIGQGLLASEGHGATGIFDSPEGFAALVVAHTDALIAALGEEPVE